MKAVFQKRRQVFLNRCIKYSRYVFNDHFVLVLLVFLGFLSLQYRQLLEQFPAQTGPVYLLLLAVTLLIFFAGRPATYLEAADQQFLLTKEREVLALVKRAGQRQFLIWGGLQVLGQLILLPLYLKLGLPNWGFLLYLGGLTVGKYLLVQTQLAAYQQSGVFQWEMAIAKERKRQQTILQFFALFTRVKGITTSVKRRAYLDGFLGLVAKKHEKTWDYLYIRALFRSGDFLGLSLRLVALGLVALLSIDLSWLAVGLVLLLHYLLLFQLLALYPVYDYQYLNRLYPIRQEKKRQRFQSFLQFFLYMILIVEGLLALLVLKEKIYLGVLVVGGLVLNHLYLPIKAKKLID